MESKEGKSSRSKFATIDLPSLLKVSDAAGVKTDSAVSAALGALPPTNEFQGYCSEADARAILVKYAKQKEPEQPNLVLKINGLLSSLQQTQTTAMRYAEHYWLVAGWNTILKNPTKFPQFANNIVEEQLQKSMDALERLSAVLIPEVRTMQGLRNWLTGTTNAFTGIVKNETLNPKDKHDQFVKVKYTIEKQIVPEWQRVATDNFYSKGFKQITKKLEEIEYEYQQHVIQPYIIAKLDSTALDPTFASIKDDIVKLKKKIKTCNVLSSTLLKEQSEFDKFPTAFKLQKLIKNYAVYVQAMESLQSNISSLSRLTKGNEVFPLTEYSAFIKGSLQKMTDVFEEYKTASIRVKDFSLDADLNTKTGNGPIYGWQNPTKTAAGSEKVIKVSTENYDDIQTRDDVFAKKDKTKKEVTTFNGKFGKHTSIVNDVLESSSAEVDAIISTVNKTGAWLGTEEKFRQIATNNLSKIHEYGVDTDKLDKYANTYVGTNLLHIKEAAQYTEARERILSYRDILSEFEKRQASSSDAAAQPIPKLENVYSAARSLLGQYPNALFLSVPTDKAEYEYITTSSILLDHYGIFSKQNVANYNAGISGGVLKVLRFEKLGPNGQVLRSYVNAFPLTNLYDPELEDALQDAADKTRYGPGNANFLNLKELKTIRERLYKAVVRDCNAAKQTACTKKQIKRQLQLTNFWQKNHVLSKTKTYEQAQKIGMHLHAQRSTDDADVKWEDMLDTATGKIKRSKLGPNAFDLINQAWNRKYFARKQADGKFDCSHLYGSGNGRYPSWQETTLYTEVAPGIKRKKIVCRPSQYKTLTQDSSDPELQFQHNVHRGYYKHRKNVLSSVGASDVKRGTMHYVVPASTPHTETLQENLRNSSGTAIGNVYDVLRSRDARPGIRTVSGFAATSANEESDSDLDMFDD